MYTTGEKHSGRFVKQLKRILANKKKRKFFIRRLTILACLLLVLGSSLYMLLRPKPSIRKPNHGSEGIADEKSSRSNSRTEPASEGGKILPEDDISYMGNKSYLNDKPVVIDAGHGGIDPGTNIGDLFEKDINLDVALKMSKILDEAGIKTILTRDDDTFMKPSEKIGFANKNNACLFVSIHCNSFEDSSVSGTTTLYYPSDYKDAGNLSGREFASIIQEELMKLINTRDRGILSSPKTIVLKYSKMPSALVELAFMTNPSDAALLASEDFRQKAAEGIANGIIRAVEILYSETEPEADTAETGTGSLQAETDTDTETDTGTLS